MVNRKHIALENEYISKIQPLIDKHNGNLSAAIRDAIELTNIALQYYPSIEDAKSLITTLKEIQEDQIIIQVPLFQWLLKKTRGLIIDKQILDYIIDPFSITTISELEDFINNMCRDFGWHVDVMIDSDNNDNPTNATVTYTGIHKENIYHLARMLGEYLAIYKKLGIVSVHPQLGELEIDFELRSSIDEALKNLVDNLGYMVNIEKELKAYPNFWNRLISEHSATNYSLVSIHKDFYEDLMSGKIPKAIFTIESAASRPLEDMPLSQFLHTIKIISETSRMVNKVYVEGENLKIRHGFRSMKAVENTKNVFINILESSCYNYDAEITSTFIYLRHHPEIEDKTQELLNKLSKNGEFVQEIISEFVKYLKTVEDIDFIEQIKSFGRGLGRMLMKQYEEKYGSKYWDMQTFKKAIEPADKQIKSNWELRSNSLRYTVHECAYADDPKKCHMHREIFKGAIEYAFGDLADVDAIKLLSHGDEYCDVNIHTH
jgi:predicted hydrocarbon binding protein